MNAIAATAPVITERPEGLRITGLLDRAIARLAALVPVAPAARAAEPLWFVRVTAASIDVVPYRRGRLAFSPDAAVSLLSMGARDRLRLRGVLDELARTAALDAANRAAGGTLFVAGGALIVAEFPETGPALIVSQLA